MKLSKIKNYRPHVIIYSKHHGKTMSLKSQIELKARPDQFIGQGIEATVITNLDLPFEGCKSLLMFISADEFGLEVIFQLLKEIQMSMMIILMR